VPQRKILVINWQDIKNPFGGGAEVHMHEIFKRIASMGHDVTIFSCDIDGEANEEIIDGIKIIRKGKRSTFNYGVKKMYKTKFIHENYDIIIDDINKIPFYTPRYVKEPLLAISHHFFGASIYRETNFAAGTYVYLSEWLVNRVYRKTPFAVVSESTLQEFIDRGFDRELFDIVPNAIEQNDFPMKVGKKADPPIIAYFGRLKKYKSPDHLIKAFASIEKKHRDAKLQILGKGDFMEYMQQLSIELGIEKKVKFFGFVTEEDKKRLLSEATCCVNTSMKEGWGITNIEANACGTPVISANVPGLRDSVKDGQSGMLYEYGNIDELAEKLDNLLSDDELKNTLYKGSIEWASQFSWQQSAELMLEKIEKVIRDKY
jgi:glycosyltransferase involved in cell wall biosynthesis